MNISSTISSVKEFLERGLWRIEDTHIGQFNRRLFGLLRIIVIAVKGFIEEKASVRASALTYFTLLSIVPIIALAFAIAKGFGLEEVLTDLIQSSMGHSPEVCDYLISFADNSLAKARGGVIAGVGVVMLLYSVFKLLSNVEEAFNDLWYIKRSRTVVRKITDYVAIMIFGPILLLAASSATVFVKSFLQVAFQGEFSDFQSMLLRFAPYFIMWVVFSLLYLILPNTRVSPKAAIVSGIITGTVLQFVQWVYITFQVGVSNAGAVYGSFAFLPLLLAWIQLTWIIVLAGCKFAFSIQNVSDYSLERGAENVSFATRKKAAVIIMRKIATRFANQEPMPDARSLAEELEVSQSFLFQTVDLLRRAGLLVEVVIPDTTIGRTYIPAIDIHQLSHNMICQRLENLGDDSNFHILRDADYDFVIKESDEAMRSGTSVAGNSSLIALPE